MSSAEERREARRRKILQNSDDRMKRLLGENANVPSKSTLPQETTEVPSPVDSFNSTSLSTESRLENLETNAGDSTASTDSHSETVKSETVSKRVGPGTVKIQKNPSNVPTSMGHLNNETVTSRSKPNVKQNNSDELLKILDQLRIGAMILTAVIVRWILSFGFGVFYVQSIFVPFIVTEVALYFFQHNNMQNLVLPHKGGLLSGALILCGIKPDLIAVYNKTMGYVAAITEDCAIFFIYFLSVQYVYE